MISRGQELALWQLKEISSADGWSLFIEEVQEPNDQIPYLKIRISIRIGPIKIVEEGLQLHDREEFVLFIPQQFPFLKPEVSIEHDRFSGKPHVQWIHHLCLYQSSTEWNVSDGMFGLIDRLELWLTKGAMNQLDPDDQPLHPPAVYSDVRIGKLIIPKEDTPKFDDPFWLGFTSITKFPERIELGSWHNLDDPSIRGEVAVALLFSSPLPWEYPIKGSILFEEFERHGIAKEVLFRILKASSMLTPQGDQMYLVVGSPMRGIAGGDRKQHLSVWVLDAEAVDYIRITINQTADTTEIAEIRKKIQDLITQCLENSKISWCPIIEARPEVTIRRDYNSHLSFFRGKSVSIWGCGALGGNIAMFLGRAGVSKLVLRDNGIVTPGILVRQVYTGSDVGQQKVEALRMHLLSISYLSTPEIVVQSTNIVNELSSEAFDWTDGCEFIIDATASDLVRRKLDIIWNKSSFRKIPIASVMINQSADQVISVVSGPNYSGASWDVMRKSKIEILRNIDLLDYANSFFPSEIMQKPFQPEPGCSEPTFIGSGADCAALSAIGTNYIANVFNSKINNQASSHLFSQSDASSKKFEFQPDIVVPVETCEIRLTHGQ